MIPWCLSSNQFPFHSQNGTDTPLGLPQNDFEDGWVCFQNTQLEQEMAQKKNMQLKTSDSAKFHRLVKEDWKIYKLNGNSVTGEIYMLREKNHNNLAAAKALNEMIDITEFEASNDLGKSL